MSNLKEYKKLNSFNEFFSKSIDQDEKLVIKKVEDSIGMKKNLESLSLRQKEILKEVKNDLFNTDIDKKVKFKLSKHVIEELKRLEIQKIPLYLVHRYRYEIFPEIQN